MEIRRTILTAGAASGGLLAAAFLSAATAVANTGDSAEPGPIISAFSSADSGLGATGTTNTGDVGTFTVPNVLTDDPSDILAIFETSADTTSFFGISNTKLTTTDLHVNFDGDGAGYVTDSDVDADDDGTTFASDDIVDADSDDITFAEDGDVNIDGDKLSHFGDTSIDVDGDDVEFASDDDADIDDDNTVHSEDTSINVDDDGYQFGSDSTVDVDDDGITYAGDLFIDADEDGTLLGDGLVDIDGDGTALAGETDPAALLEPAAVPTVGSVSDIATLDGLFGDWTFSYSDVLTPAESAGTVLDNAELFDADVVDEGITATLTTPFSDEAIDVSQYFDGEGLFDLGFLIDLL